jgi:hypothetical protein
MMMDDGLRARGVDASPDVKVDIEGLQEKRPKHSRLATSVQAGKADSFGGD